MRNCVFILLTFCFCNLLSAQEYPVEWHTNKSKEYPYLDIEEPIKGELSLVKVSIDDKEYYQTVENRYTKFILKAFDLEHNKISEINLDYKVKGQKTTLQGIIQLKNQGGILRMHEGKKQIKLFVTPFTVQKAAPTQEFYQFDHKRKTRATHDVFNYLTQSANDKYIAYAYPLSRMKKEESQKVKIVVFDNEMKLLWEKVHTFDTPDRHIDLKKLQVDNSGNVFLLAGTMRRSMFKVDDYEKVNYKIFQFGKNSFKVQEIEIEEEILKRKVPQFYFLNDDDDNNKFILYGTYSTNNKNGVYYITGNADGFLTQEKVKNKKYNGEIQDHFPTRYLKYSDGSICIVSSAYYGFATTYGNILVFKFSKEGKHIFTKRINRDLLMYSDYKSPLYPPNMICAIYDDKLHILSHRSPKESEIEVKMAHTVGDFRGERIFAKMTVLDKNGKEVFKKDIFSLDTKGSGYYKLIPHVSLQYGSKLLIFAADSMHQGEYQFGLLSLE